jgi:hypothetical protein
MRFLFRRKKFASVTKWRKKCLTKCTVNKLLFVCNSKVYFKRHCLNKRLIVTQMIHFVLSCFVIEILVFSGSFWLTQFTIILRNSSTGSWKAFSNPVLSEVKKIVVSSRLRKHRHKLQIVWFVRETWITRKHQISYNWKSSSFANRKKTEVESSVCSEVAASRFKRSLEVYKRRFWLNGCFRLTQSL